jgi:hypothetical protein
MDRVMTEAYGQRLGEAMRAKNSPTIITRALRTADMAVTEIRCDNLLPEMNGPIRQEDAFLVALHLRDRPNAEFPSDFVGCTGGAQNSGSGDIERDPAIRTTGTVGPLYATSASSTRIRPCWCSATVRTSPRYRHAGPSKKILQSREKTFNSDTTLTGKL